MKLMVVKINDTEIIITLNTASPKIIYLLPSATHNTQDKYYKMKNGAVNSFTK
jgi:hypothetical protein